MATIDWNWFFSSIAQSSAAIVGIFGAFIITKCLNNKSVFLAVNAEIDKAIDGAEALKLKADNRYFAWYNEKYHKSALRSLEKMYDESLDELESKSIEELFKELKFSIFDDKQECLNSIASGLNVLRAESAKIRAEEEAHRRASKQLNDSPFKNLLQPVMQANAFFSRSERTSISGGLMIQNWDGVTEEREYIDALHVEIEVHKKLLKRLLLSTAGNPQRSKEITISIFALCLLFYTGVVLPICFMPVALNEVAIFNFASIIPAAFSVKGALVAVFSMAFTIIPFVFIRLNWSLVYSPEKIMTVTNFGESKSYSKYYAIAESNRALTEASPNKG